MEANSHSRIIRSGFLTTKTADINDEKSWKVCRIELIDNGILNVYKTASEDLLKRLFFFGKNNPWKSKSETSLPPLSLNNTRPSYSLSSIFDVGKKKRNSDVGMRIPPRRLSSPETNTNLSASDFDTTKPDKPFKYNNELHSKSACYSDVFIEVDEASNTMRGFICALIFETAVVFCYSRPSSPLIKQARIHGVSLQEKSLSILSEVLGSAGLLEVSSLLNGSTKSVGRTSTLKPFCKWKFDSGTEITSVKTAQISSSSKLKPSISFILEHKGSNKSFVARSELSKLNWIEALDRIQNGSLPRDSIVTSPKTYDQFADLLDNTSTSLPNNFLSRSLNEDKKHFVPLRSGIIKNSTKPFISIKLDDTEIGYCDIARRDYGKFLDS